MLLSHRLTSLPGKDLVGIRLHVAVDIVCSRLLIDGVVQINHSGSSLPC